MSADDSGVGFTVKEIVIDIRDTVRALDEKMDRIDREGSIGTREELGDHENRLRSLESAFNSFHNRQMGAFSLIVFIMPVLATISWHLWG